MVRCPVCDATTVTIVLTTKPRASCSECGATWVQEGIWQRAIRPGQPKLPLVGVTSLVVSSPAVNGSAGVAGDDVIVLPDPVQRPRRHTPRREPSADEAVAT